MLQNLTDDRSTSVQVRAWFRQAKRSEPASSNATWRHIGSNDDLVQGGTKSLLINENIWSSKSLKASQCIYSNIPSLSMTRHFFQ